MNIISCTAVYYDDNGVQHTDAMFSADFEKLPVNNLAEIRDAGNVRNVVILNNKIVQAGGYSQDRGLFVDLY